MRRKLTAPMACVLSLIDRTLHHGSHKVEYSVLRVSHNGFYHLKAEDPILSVGACKLFTGTLIPQNAQGHIEML